MRLQKLINIQFFFNMERSCTHPELDIDELELDPIPEETHKDI